MLISSLLYLYVYIIMAIVIYRLPQYRRRWLHPINCVMFFSGLQVFSNLYLALNDSVFNDFVIGIIDIYEGDASTFQYAILLELCSFIFLLTGVLFFNTSYNNRPFCFKKLNSSYFLLIGLLFTFLFFQSAGGVLNYWKNIALRTTSNAGLGYYQSIAMYSLIFYFVIPSKKNRYSILLKSLTILVLLSFGSRGMVIIAILSKILINQELVGMQIRKIYLISISSGLILFLLVVLGIRKDGFDSFLESPISQIKSGISLLEEGLIVRVGKLEREYVILKKWDLNNYWFGREYYNLLTSPIPRSIYPNKRPVDTGVYVRLASINKKYDLDQVANDLDVNSWPQQNWSGYMNFGLFGLFGYHLISGILLSFLYKLRSRSPLYFVSYCLIFMGGGIILSVPGIVKVLTLFVILGVIYKVVRFGSNFNFRFR